MYPLLLKPLVLGIKNDLIREYKKNFWNRTTFALIFMMFILFGMYEISYSFFLKFKNHNLFSESLFSQFLSLSLLALFSVTTFSSVVSSMSAIFSSKDLALYLSAPTSLKNIFSAKLIQVTILSTWMFSLIMTAFGLGLIRALDVSLLHIFLWMSGGVLFALIPAALGIIIVIFIANIVPAERLKEVIILFVVMGLLSILTYDQETTMNTKMTDSVNKAVILSKRFSSANIEFLPNHALANIISSSIFKPKDIFHYSSLLFLESLLSVLLSYITFKAFFLRGWSRSTNSNAQKILYKSYLSSKIGNLLFPKPSCLRAFAGKEIRMFVRDTTQSIQLLLLLTLTFVYLYNFRAIQSGTIINGDYREAWQALLSSANIIFAGFVIAAVCTRFVYPSISLEGTTYQILRSVPITLEDFLRYKFLTWFIPICILSLILFISGGMAIQADMFSIFGMSVVGICLAASLVAGALGVGACYAKFNWDNPIQVTSGFGSLVYMALSMFIVFINLIPASIFFIFCNVSFLRTKLEVIDFNFAQTCCLFIVIAINGAIIRKSLQIGASKLKELED